MKTTNLFRLLTGLACTALVISCNKNNVKSGSTSTNADLQTQADDQAQVSNESDAVSNDASTVMYSSAAISGNSVVTRGSTGTTTNSMNEDNGVNGPLGIIICDATITWDTTSTTRTVTITYNGSNCWGNRTRTGVVTITVPTGVYWGQAGATVTINIQDLKITRVRDNKSIVINGTKTFTNESGGRLVDLASLTSVIHDVTGNMSITFNNGTQRTWGESKHRVFTYNNGVVITTTGTHTDSLGNSNVAEWGTNRFGVGFESLITQPKIIRQDCDFRLVSGENQILRTDNVTTDVTYGLDANGNPTSCPGSGTYYFKVVRTNAGGVSFTAILPY